MNKAPGYPLPASNPANIRFGLQNLGIIEVTAFNFAAVNQMRLQLIHFWPWRIHTWPQPESMVFTLRFGLN